MTIPQATRKHLAFLFIFAVIAFGAYRAWLYGLAQTFPTTMAMFADVVNSHAECQAPCWQELTIGQANEAAFTTLVETAPATRFTDLERDVANFGVNVTYHWHDLQQDAQYRLLIHDGTLSELTVSWARRDRPVSGDALALLGPPDVYTAGPIGEFEDPHVLLNLYYESHGIVIDVWQPADFDIGAACEFVLDEQTAIRSLQLFRPGRASALAINAGNPAVPSDRPVWPAAGASVAFTSTGCR